MGTIYDKIILFFACSIFSMVFKIQTLTIVVLLAALIISCFNSYFHNCFFTLATALIYAALCFLWPEYCIYIPLIIYDALQYKLWLPSGILLASGISFISRESMFSSALLILFILFSALLQYRTFRLGVLEEQLKKQRDDSRELNLLLESRNKSLIQRQDYEIHLATLKERNRIAREIHDHVGHMLSRSILQVGALMTINKDPGVSSHLTTLKDSLSTAMDNIRQSVHDLHDDSLNLQDAVEAIIKGVPNYDIQFEYDLEDDPPSTLKYCFISTVKEALSNVVKHSNATQVCIIFREHPAFYQLLIHDNGTQAPKYSGEGIGLENMQERVLNLKGTFKITRESGFKIFISIPK